MAEILPSPLFPPSVRYQTEEATSPWLTTAEAAKRGKVGSKSIYAAVRAKRLRAARIGGRRELRFLAAWVDQWLEATAEPIEITRGPLRVAR
jgi:excisionase family DNA binding protein